MNTHQNRENHLIKLIAIIVNTIYAYISISFHKLFHHLRHNQCYSYYLYTHNKLYVCIQKNFIIKKERETEENN